MNKNIKEQYTTVDEYGRQVVKTVYENGQIEIHGPVSSKYEEHRKVRLVKSKQEVENEIRKFKKIMLVLCSRSVFRN